MNTTWYFNAIGPHLNAYSIEPNGVDLRLAASIELPAWVMYVWPHPSKPLLYVTSSDGGPTGKVGETHHANVLRIDPVTGVMSQASPPRALPYRPVHCSLDAKGRYLLVAFNSPSSVAVHPLDDDGAIGEAVEQPADLDVGIFAHQIMATPSNKAVILVTRGNDAETNKPEDPGALKLYGFDDGRLSLRASIAPGDGDGLGFGPRHLDFHSNARWVYVSVERQNELHLYELDEQDALSPEPLFSADSLRERSAMDFGKQLGGAIHVHPNGQFVYQSNRNNTLVEDDTWPVLHGGENSLVVYAIDAASGEPTPIQHIDTGSIHVRTFSLYPTGRLLIAATITPVPVRAENGDIHLRPAAILVYRVGDDGRLTLARTYEVDTCGTAMWWSGILSVPSG